MFLLLKLYGIKSWYKVKFKKSQIVGDIFWDRIISFMMVDPLIIVVDLACSGQSCPWFVYVKCGKVRVKRLYVGLWRVQERLDVVGRERLYW